VYIEEDAVKDSYQPDQCKALSYFGNSLQEQVLAYQHLLDNIQDGICVLDLHGCFSFINDAMAKRIGTPKEQMLGRACFDIIRPQEIDNALKDFRAVIGGMSRHLVLSHEGPTGENLWDQIDAIPLYGGSNIIGILAITRDITAKKRAKEEILLYRNNLEDLVEKRTAELISANRGLQKEIENRKRAEEALRDSEDYYKAIFQNTGTAMVIMEEDTTIVSVNKESVRFVGLTPEELKGKRKAIEFVAPEYYQQVWENRNQRLIDPEKPPKGYEFTIIDRSGNPKDIYMTVELIPDKKKIIASFIDISVLKKTEKALKESEAYYRTIFENTGTATVILEEDGTISLANSECQKLLGYYPGELEGKKKTVDLVVDADREKMLTYHHMRRVDPDKPPKAYELMLRHRSGHTKEFLVTVAMIPGTTKSIASFFDLSERKRIEAAMAESEKKYRNIFERATEGIYQTSLDGKIINANPAFARILGYKSPADMMKSVKDVTYDVYNNPKRRAELVKLMEKSGHVQDFDVECRRPDGKKMWISTNVRAVRDETGKDLFYEGTLVDITERKKMEEEIQSKTESLEETNAALRVLLKHREKDSAELEEKIVQNARELVLPYITRIRESKTGRDSDLAEIAESNLNDILTPFIKNMTAKYDCFTPKEIQIADLMKKGKTTKEIAQILCLSTRTVDVHRYKIREKLGIKSKKINLQSYLLSL
jgi:PAS domain S-box-containing protein